MNPDILHPIGHPALGWIIPLAVFVVASLLTWLLYRHFSRPNE